MSTLYRIALRLHENHMGLVFTDKNGDFGAISVTERSCAALHRSLKWCVTYRIGVHTLTGKHIVSARKAIRYVWYEHSLRDRRHFLLRQAAQDTCAGIIYIYSGLPITRTFKGNQTEKFELSRVPVRKRELEANSRK